MKNEDEKSQSKKKYSFGSFEKVPLKASDLQNSVFALMHSDPGADGCDPSKVMNDLSGLACSY